ncbi:MAG: lysophospholipid acyltransferase family protein [Acidobacteriota bacterium]
MRSLYAIPILILNTVVMGCLSMLALLIDRSGRLSHLVARYWSRCILYTCGVRVRLHGTVSSDPKAAYIVMSNHQGILDIPLLFAYLPLQFRIMAKRSLFLIPFLGWHLYLSGHIPINRRSMRQSAKALLRAAGKVKRGTSIVLFPEGTRSRDGQPGQFKLGGFRLAQEHELPILPVTIDGSLPILPKGSAWIRSAPPVNLTFHPPVTAGGLADRAELVEKVRSAIVGALPGVKEASPQAAMAD